MLLDDDDGGGGGKSIMALGGARPCTSVNAPSSTYVYAPPFGVSDISYATRRWHPISTICYDDVKSPTKLSCNTYGDNDSDIVSRNH